MNRKVLSRPSLQPNKIAEVKSSIKKWAEDCYIKLSAHVDLKLMFKMIVLVIAVSTDPLFLYVPILNEKKKCLEMDKELKIVALVLRSATDLYYVVRIIREIHDGFVNSDSKRESPATSQELAAGEEEVYGFGQKKPWFRHHELVRKPLAVARRIHWFHILIDVLAVLPIPQVIILLLFSKMWGSFRFLSTRKLLYIILLFQYVIRVIHIYRLCEKLRKNTSVLTGIVWIKGGFNLFLYIIACHVLGAFWYFFAIQRVIRCWLDACKKHPGCLPSTFECSDDTTLRKMSFLEVFCPINRPNPKIFNFGIFLDAIYSGMLSSSDFTKKLGQCFWWGLQNISSFGSDLQPSDNIWEIFFASNISIIGLLLFLYLIGNLQVYMQLATTKWEELREKMKMKEPEIDLWISSHNLPLNIKEKVMKHIRDPLKNDEDVDLNNIFALLNEHIKRQKDIETMETEIEKACLLLATNMSEGKRLQRNMKDLNIEYWMSNNKIEKNLKPKIKQCVFCKLQDDKEVNIVTVLSVLPGDLRTSVKKHLCLPTLRKVPQLEMKERVHAAIIEYLKPVVYSENEYIIREGEPLDFMIFITQGVAWNFEAAHSTTNGGITSTSSSVNVKLLQKGDFYGKELLNCEILSTESLKNVPISASNVKSHTKVEAFVLMAIDLKHVQTRFWWIFRHLVAKTDHLEKLLVELAVATVVKALQRQVKEGKNMKPHDPQSAPSSSGGGKVDALSRV